MLDALGIAEGWRCLEVGAGGGSLVQWMADRGATVTAIDIDTRFLEQLAGDELVEWRKAPRYTPEIREALVTDNSNFSTQHRTVS